MNNRLPAYPLITHDPYFSCWSFADNPADDAQRHWSGAWFNMPVRIDLDGKLYRLMGCGAPAEKAPLFSGVESNGYPNFSDMGVCGNPAYADLPHSGTAGRL